MKHSIGCDCRECETRARQYTGFLAVVFGVLAIAGIYHVGHALLILSR